MPGSGSEKRQRKVILKMRCTEQEAALIREQASRAGVPVGALLRYAVLGTPPLRARRQPAVSEERAGQLLGMLARYVAALKEAAARGTPGACDEEIKAACRDAAELRALWFEAMGFEP